jgi:hypothetical protein
MIGTSPRPLDIRTPPPPAPVLNLLAQSHRWWQLVSIPDGGAVLAGLASDALWQGSVARVPCWHPNDPNAGPCACGLHAPAAALERARSLSAIVVGGGVRVLSVEHGDRQRPITIVSVEGPLQLVAWCAGGGDGFSLERCDRTPRWVLPGAPTSATCHRHLRRVPDRHRGRRLPFEQFMTDTVTRLGRRYGVEASMAAADLGAAPPALARPTRLNPHRVAAHP